MESYELESVIRDAVEEAIRNSVNFDAVTSSYFRSVEDKLDEISQKLDEIIKLLNYIAANCAKK